MGSGNRLVSGALPSQWPCRISCTSGGKTGHWWQAFSRTGMIPRSVHLSQPVPGITNIPRLRHMGMAMATGGLHYVGWDQLELLDYGCTGATGTGTMSPQSLPIIHTKAPYLMAGQPHFTPCTDRHFHLKPFLEFSGNGRLHLARQRHLATEASPASKWKRPAWEKYMSYHITQRRQCARASQGDWLNEYEFTIFWVGRTRFTGNLYTSRSEQAKRQF